MAAMVQCVWMVGYLYYPLVSAHKRRLPQVKRATSEGKGPQQPLRFDDIILPECIPVGDGVIVHTGNATYL